MRQLPRTTGRGLSRSASSPILPRTSSRLSSSSRLRRGQRRPARDAEADDVDALGIFHAGIDGLDRIGVGDAAQRQRQRARLTGGRERGCFVWLQLQRDGLADDGALTVLLL